VGGDIRNKSHHLYFAQLITAPQFERMKIVMAKLTAIFAQGVKFRIGVTSTNEGMSIIR